MLCHVCREPAIGQCKNCNMFYCAKHGRVYCVTCDDRALAAPPGARSLSGEGRGATCYRCGRPAERACNRCGRFFCGDHADPTSHRLTCRRCASKRFWLTVGLALAVAAAAFAGIYLLLQ